MTPPLLPMPEREVHTLVSLSAQRRDRCTTACHSSSRIVDTTSTLCANLRIICGRETIKRYKKSVAIAREHPQRSRYHPTQGSRHQNKEQRDAPVIEFRLRRGALAMEHDFPDERPSSNEYSDWLEKGAPVHNDSTIAVALSREEISGLPRHARKA